VGSSLDGLVPVKEGLFAAGPDGSARLLGGRCDTCGERHFPVAASCPYCSSDTVTEAPLSPEGTLWAWTAVTAPPPGYRGEVPFGFGVVELPERIRVVTRITEADPARLQAGQAMRLEIVPVHDDEDGRPVVTYAFAPALAGAAKTPGATAGRGAAKPPAEQ
jgi:uncharacterized OB-fold protein